MHNIQKNILKEGSKREYSKYSEIRPLGIDNNLFSYHLKKLILDNLLKKHKLGYSLTEKSKLQIQKMSFEKFDLRIQPSIVTIIICQNEKKEFLMYLRKRQPNINQWWFPAGKIHENEGILESSKREFFEKTGLFIKPKHVGIVHLTFYHNSEAYLSMVSHVFFTRDFKGDLKKGNNVKDLSWKKETEIKTEKNMVPGTYKILKEVKKNKKLFFKEIFIHE